MSLPWRGSPLSPPVQQDAILLWNLLLALPWLKISNHTSLDLDAPNQKVRQSPLTFIWLGGRHCKQSSVQQRSHAASHAKNRHLAGAHDFQIMLAKLASSLEGKDSVSCLCRIHFVWGHIHHNSSSSWGIGFVSATKSHRLRNPALSCQSSTVNLWLQETEHSFKKTLLSEKNQKILKSYHSNIPWSIPISRILVDSLTMQSIIEVQILNTIGQEVRH